MMKPKPALRSLFLGSTLLAAAATSLQAAAYYWDDNADGADFGTAGASTGTWAGPTAGPTAGWSLSGTGANPFAAFTTGTSDTLNFGNGATGLGAGNVTVSGAVSSGSMTFSSGSGAIVLSGGTSITFGGTTPTITVNNAQNTISTQILQSGTGNSTGLTKAGSGELILSGTANSISGDATAAGNGVGIRLSAGTLTVSGGSLTTATAGKGIGTFSADGGNFNQTGGVVNVNATGDLIVGWNSGSTFTLSGGTTSAANIRHQDGGAGVITISGTNTTTVGNVSHTTAGGGTDSLTVNLNTGGTLAANTLTMNLSASALTSGNHSLNVNFDGGTLKARGTGNLIASTPMATSTRAINVTVKAGGAIVNTDGFTATINQPLVHDSGGPAIDGGLTKSGAGTLALAGGASTYTGATTINAGTLRVGTAGTASAVTIANSGFEAPATGSWTYNPTVAAQGGTGWTFNPQSGVAKTTFFTTAPPEGVQAGFIQATGTFSQSITVSADGLYQIAFQAQGRGGSSGPNGVIVQVNGVSVGTWAATDISQSQWLSYAAGVNLTAGTHTLTFIGNNTIGGDKSLSIDNVQMGQATGSLPTNTAVNLTTSGAILDLNHTSQTIGSLTGVAGTSVINGNLIIGGTDTTTFAGVISGTESSLSITGDGTLTLSGTNTYAGATTVTAGTLKIDGSTSASSAVAVSNGAALGGDGIVGGSATFDNSSIFSWGLSVDTPTSTISTTVSDTLAVTGNLVDGDAAGGSVFKILLAGTQTFADNFWNASHSWTNVLTSGNSLNLSGLFTSFSYANASGTTAAPTTGSFSLSGSTLSFTAIPEPTSALGGLLLTAGLLRRRRK